jgi:tetratricopeptide (TPR) repeat protein
LLVEMNRPDEALEYLARASDGLPQRARIHYNLGLLYQQQGQLPAAESKLLQALSVQPENPDFQFALADHYLRRNQPEKALPVVQALARTNPRHPALPGMLRVIEATSARPGPRDDTKESQ